MWIKLATREQLPRNAGSRIRGKTMKKTALSIFALCASLYLGGCVIVEDEATLFIYNDSDYPVTEVYLAEEFEGSWGPNLIPPGIVLETGDSLEIVDIECGDYDVLIVDEFGGECELLNLDLCLNDTDFHITNSLLDVCF